jgi:Fur family peroxide stress response transcriptional regulator
MEPVRKHSRKRDAILACLRGTTCHPPAEWVYRQLKPELPDLSLGTVYRNLALFKQEGTIESVGIVDGLERFDGRIAPHCHFVCLGCGAVIDVETTELSGELVELAGRETGGQVTSYRLNYFGFCEKCKKN